MDVVWLGDDECHDQELVGDKAASLSRLYHSQRIPLGYCVTTLAFDRALRAGMRPDTGGMGRGSAAAELREAVELGYRSLALRLGQPEPPVAVRASAIGVGAEREQLATTHTTPLNVVGAAKVYSALASLWTNAREALELEYEHRYHRALINPRVAVLVQGLVAADVTIHVQSAGTDSEMRDQILVRAGFGLGRDQDGREFEADTFVVSRETLDLVERTLVHKRAMTVRDRQGTRVAEVPIFSRDQPSLTDEQLHSVVLLALELEQQVRWHIEFECAYQDDQLYLLQCQPLLGLGPLPEPIVAIQEPIEAGDPGEPEEELTSPLDSA